MLKHFCPLPLVLICFVIGLHAQPFPGWINYTYGPNITSLADAGNILWVGTEAGLVRLDKNSGEMRFYNRANSGITDNEIFDVAADSAGGVWIAAGRSSDHSTFAHFDGNNWRRFAPLYAWAASVVVDRTHKPWFVTSSLGSVAYEDVDRSRTYIISPNNPDFGHAVADSRGDIWVKRASTPGLVRISSGAIINYTAADCPFLDQEIEALCPDRAGNMWFGNGHGLIRFDGKNWTRFMPSGLDSLIVAVGEGANGEMWVGTRHGAGRFDGSTWSAFDTTNSKLANAWVNAIVTDREGTVWFGTTVGLVSYNGSTWQRFGTSNSGLGSAGILKIVVDRKGTRWMANDNLVRFDSVWTTVPLPDFGSGRRAYARTLALDRDGALLVGTGEGLARYDGTNWKIYTTGNGALVSNDIHCVAVDRAGNYWLSLRGTKPVIGRFDGANWTFYDSTNSGLPRNFGAESIAIDSSGNVWAAMPYAGVAKFDGTSWSALSSGFPSGFSPGLVRTIGVDRGGTIWFAGTGRVVCAFDAASNTWRAYDSTSAPLAGKTLVSITVAPNGGIWMGTGGYSGTQYGAMYFNGTSWREFSLENSGLPDGTLYDIAVDSAGGVWFATARGIGVFSPGPSLAVPGSGNAASGMTFLQSSPNPFTSRTMIDYEVTGQNAVPVALSVTDMQGNDIAVLVRGTIVPGHYSTPLDASAIPSGSYFCRLRAGDRSAIIRIELVR